ncbi:hypothetical protein KUTeg_000839 [Tegillarca granosa]|uniref:SMC hinge domain-containing protein n=1 Tax=Tegillarca granosa TaxID=220873 RepID=A0ABQ9FYP7_TEGGR|nr:hypothetical protein KUTeg_000839 [Tegillarca granosa]
MYVLRDINQELCAPAEERVSYLPHYDTIVKGGMYEYYASEGQNPLPYAFAELIDNALAATANNSGPRSIHIRMHFDDMMASRNALYVIDNGKGMTPRQLNNWAIYRLSKFIRKDKRGKVSFIEDEDAEEEKKDDLAPLSLNSDISYFGVGGKQAVFFIGNSVRMISKPKDSKDVHELTMSKEEFQMKERNQEAIYSGVIRNRKPGDFSHVPETDENVRQIIKEENDRDNFTVVEIKGINPDHITYLKQRFKEWTRQLAHIYHYYIHGPSGNVDEDKNRSTSPFKNIDIEVTMINRVHNRTYPAIHINLRDIDDDMQTQFVRSAASTFEFKAKVEGSGVVEGILRYHPFLYDRETYPSDLNDPRMEPETFDEHDYAINDRPARGRRPIFECYWNGRLIPYTFIENFDWCAEPKKTKNIPLDCYNRVSGILFTNDHFQVSTNKLTFLDLEMKLKEKNTAYSRIQNSQEKRTTIEREFLTWLKECHEQCDKQIFFSGYKGQCVRNDLPKAKQTPWASYDQVEWDGKTYKKGQMIRIARTMPVLLGTIKQFLLYGEHDGDVYATGGDIEIFQEPRSLYDEVKIVPLSKLDRTASHQMVKRNLEEEEAKLPSSLVISWPEGFEVKQNEKRPAGKTIGAIKIEILNRKREFISKLPGTAANSKKLLVELKVIWHSPHGDEVIVSHISQHGKNWPYWFRKMENIKNLGNHTLQIQVILNESGANTYAGKELPSHKIKFCVTEAEPEKFTVGMLDGPFYIGVPFQIPLEFQDEFNNPTKPLGKAVPVLEASGLELTFEGTLIKGNNLIVKGVVAKGKVGLVNSNRSSNSFQLTIHVFGIENSQTMKIRLLPGPPKSIMVKPEEELEIENGTAPQYSIEIHDESGNLTSSAKSQVQCKFTGVSGLPTYTLMCSDVGSGILTGEPILIKRMKDAQSITAKFELLGSGLKDVSSVQRKLKILPSGRVASIEVFYQEEEKGEAKALINGETISGVAGEYIRRLSFKLFDEAGREVEVDDKLFPKIKTNWVQKTNKDMIFSGKLPDVKVPASVSDVKYCQISLQDNSGTDTNFVVKPTAGVPTQLKCKCDGSNVVSIGETFTTPVIITVKDKYGNEILDLDKKTANEFNVSGNGIISKDVKVTHEKGNFVVKNIKFDEGAVGTKDVQISWNDLRDFVKIEMIAGPPSKLSLPGWDLEETVSVYNGNALPNNLIIQLCDAGGNPAKVPDVRIQLTKEPKIKLIPGPQPSKTNDAGQVNYGSLSVSAPRGTYEIQPKAFTSDGAILGPKLRIHVQPDPMHPTEMKVDFEKNASFVVGEKVPDIIVKVISEDDSPMASAKASSLSMKLWKMEVSTQKNPPPRAQSYSPDAVKNQPGVFTFKDRRIPEVAGVHNIMITYYDGKYELFSNVMTVDVKPGPPVKLAPVEQPGTPTVSNTHNASARCLIRNLRLELRDKFDNPAGLGYSGKVHIEITAPSGETDVPNFIGGTRKLDLTLTNGQCMLSNLILQENTSGKDGLEYVLTCEVKCDRLQRNNKLPPYEIPFLFYNDAKKQTQMAALSKERDNLQTVIRTYKSLFETTEQLVSELKISVHEAQQEETRLKEDLRRQKIALVQLQSVESVEKLLHLKTKEKELLFTAPRRTCTLNAVPHDPDIIGKIGHLALVSDTDIARVLSWHMSADMDCVVTKTTAKAKDVYKMTHGKQQVLPLDSIFKKNLPDWRKPLPHLKYRSSWKPAGNPMYARDMLVFPKHEEECKIVFGMLLGDTLILDTLEQANNYRQELVKFTFCPTILTREGDRIRSNGKFGGLMNKALPIEKLRGAVFGEPMPEKYQDLFVQIEMLQNYKVTMMKCKKAKEELQEQLDHMKLPEMQDKYKECKEAESQLKDIEQKLGHDNVIS